MTGRAGGRTERRRGVCQGKIIDAPRHGLHYLAVEEAEDASNEQTLEKEKGEMRDGGGRGRGRGEVNTNCERRREEERKRERGGGKIEKIERDSEEGKEAC